jgi:VWFA-related protein
MKILNCAPLILLSAIIFYAQTPEPTATPAREFGWSLKEEPAKKPQTQKGETVAQVSANKEDDEDIIRVETNLVVNDVYVTDRQGRVITGLKKEDFVVREDGRPQTIETFALGDDVVIPRSIVLVMDYSVSQLPYIVTSVEAAKSLVDQLNPRDKMALVTDDIELLTGFTQDKNLLKDKLEYLKQKALTGQVGKSEQYSALYAVLNEIFSDADVRPIVFFQTDGDEDYALKKSGILSDASLPERKFSYEDVLTAAERARSTIYAIAPGANYNGISDSQQLDKAKKDDEMKRNSYAQIGRVVPPKMDSGLLASSVKATLRRQEYLDRLAKSTGGWLSNLETPEQANEIYAKILDEINRRYVIGYYPTNETRDGKRRTVRIDVKNHPEYVVSGRKTYFAAPRVENE